MLCVDCREHMEPIKESYFFRHVMYFICDRCGGIWLDRFEREKVLTTGLDELTYLEAPTVQPLPQICELENGPPRCVQCPNQQLAKMQFISAGILLGSCPKCGGLWVDGHELAKIDHYIHWFDREFKPSTFARLLHHIHSTFWDRIDTNPSVKHRKEGMRIL